MSLLHVVEAVVQSSRSDMCLAEREDGAVEVWPAPHPSLAPEPTPDDRRVILARCLAALQGSGLSVEFAYRGASFIRCRAEPPRSDGTRSGARSHAAGDSCDEAAQARRVAVVQGGSPHG